MTQRIDVPGMGLVEFPDGMSDADMAAAIKRTMAAQKPEGPAPTYGALIPNAANKAIAGTADLVLNAPTNVWNLLKAGYGAIKGGPDMPELTPTPDYARRGMTALGMIRPEAEPVGPTQRVVDSAVQGATGMMMNPSASVGQAAALGATGALSGAAAQGTKEATGSDVAAQSVGVLAPLGVNMAANAARAKVADLQAQQSRNAPRDQALAAGREAGFQVPPTMVKPGDRLLESVAGKQAVQQEASINNAEVTNRLARQSIGLAPDAPLTPEAAQAVRRQAYATGYAPLESAGAISTGRLYRQELDRISAKYEGAAADFPKAVRDDVRAMIDGLRVRTFDAGNGIKMAQILRDDAGKAFASGDAALGRARIEAANAIEAQIERGIAPTTPNAPRLLENFRDARRLMAKAHTIEDAIVPGTGSVDARKLGAALTKGAPLEGEQRVIAEFANNFPKAMQPPSMVGSPGVSKLGAFAAALLGSGGAGAGAAMGGGGGAALGGLVGAGAAVAAPGMARSYLLSNMHQKGLQPKYNPDFLDRALFAPVPNLTSGAVLPPALIADELRRQGQR